MKKVQDVEYRTGEKNEISDLVRFLRIRYIQEEYLRDLLLNREHEASNRSRNPTCFPPNIDRIWEFPNKTRISPGRGWIFHLMHGNSHRNRWKSRNPLPLPSFPKNSPTSRARIPWNLHKNAWNYKERGKDGPEKLNFLQGLEFQEN